MEFERYGHAHAHEHTAEPATPHAELGRLDLALPSQLATFMLSLIGAIHHDSSASRVAKSVVPAPVLLAR